MAIVECKEDLLLDLGCIFFEEGAGVDDTVEQLSFGAEFSYSVEESALMENVEYFDDGSTYGNGIEYLRRAISFLMPSRSSCVA